MTIGQALIYYLMWILVCFFGICWLRHYRLLIITRMWEHVTLSLMIGAVIGAVWLMFVRDYLFVLD